MRVPSPCSYLFVPANRPERFEKACAAGADAVIVDLEDAVPAADKDSAREALAAWLSPERPVLVRINGASTSWFREDLELCRRPGVAGVVLPKAEAAEELRQVAAQVSTEGVVLPIIETAIGFHHALELARAESVPRLLFGALDFQLDLGMEETTDELLYFRSQLVLWSRVACIQPPVDGITTELDDPERLRADSLRARRLGFGGKLCVHPRQIAVVHECFRPSQEALAWARRVVEAASLAKEDTFSLDGKMVDRPVLLRARQLLAAVE
jgi:citrate lyase subunit beta/citryl-CoA lyase